MKDFKKDSTLARFGRDRRVRTTTSSVERVEPRPHVQREAADAEPRPKRASYNPNFTEDNRPLHASRSFRPRTEGGYGRDAGSRGRSGYAREEGYEPRGRYGADRFRTPEERERHMNENPGLYDERPQSRAPKAKGGAPGRSFGAGRPQGHGYGSAKGHGSFGSDAAEGGRTPRYGAKPAYGPKKGAEARKGAPKGFRRDDRPKNYPKYDPNDFSGEMRLNRFIARSGICSRREADDFIAAGLVTVNGVVVTELGTKVGPADEVKFNDSRVQGEQKVYLVLNKPKGYVTSLDDPHADKTVVELVKGACSERIYPVGRLDKNSLGLLLFTNDGDLTRQLTHPSYRKKKVYQVSLDKPLTRADMDTIASGIQLEDGEIHADEIAYVKENKKEVGIEIHSGRNRIVRRIFEALGYTVCKLDRVYYAGLTKKNLKRGAWRFLTRDEVARLKSGLYE